VLLCIPGASCSSAFQEPRAPLHSRSLMHAPLHYRSFMLLYMRVHAFAYACVVLGGRIEAVAVQAMWSGSLLHIPHIYVLLENAHSCTTLRIY
jgi:hypothetical protein